MLITINGNNEIVFGPDEFKWLISKYMGDEAEYFDGFVESTYKAISAAKDKTNSDLFYYESSLESNSAAFFDILDVLKNISDILSSKRINRNKIADYVGEISKIISNQI